MVIGQEHEQISWNQTKTENKEMMVMERKSYGKKVKLVLVYFSTSKESIGREYEKYKKLGK